MLKQLCVALLIGATGCATTSTRSTTWTEPAPDYDGARAGHVESVREVVQSVQGNPAAGAVAGALIGGILFHGSAGSTLFGAAAGAGVGAAASSGSSVRRTYEVRVRFDDGDWGVFTYDGYTSYRPGDRVVLTREGLAPAGRAY